MKQYYGNYVGFSPTDESAICTGEIAVMIDEHGLFIRQATGRNVREESIPHDKLHEMTDDEVMPNDPATANKRYHGFRIGEHGAEIIFIKKPGFRDCDIFVRLGMADLLGPTVLWSRKRPLKMLLFNLRVKFLEWRFKGGIPLLRHGGKLGRLA